MNDGSIAPPKSRKDIRHLATVIRKLFGTHGNPYFDIMPMLDRLNEVFPNFEYEILPLREMGNCFAHTKTDSCLMSIREDVYDGACDGVGRDRFTIAHEIGHLFMHRPGCIVYARQDSGMQIPVFQKPEWQAETFAAELLMPKSYIRGQTTQVISRNCGVTSTAARVQLAAIEREDNRKLLIK